MIVFSLANLLKVEKIFIKKLNKKDIRFGLFFLGIIHGFTNLGGGLLTNISSAINKDKFLIRYNIAVGYFMLSLSKLLIINLFYKKLDLNNLYYLIIPIICFFLTKVIFEKIQNNLFSFSLNITILFYGLYIFFRNANILKF
tara:strand:- start:14579 stop:15004 length:426 start_codon:yes stop_codon:yes gene_type:complete